MKEERRLRVFDSRAVRRVFGPERVQLLGVWRRLHNEKLNHLYCSLNIIRMIKSRRMRWVGHVASMGDRKVAYRDLVDRHEGKKTLGRPKLRWGDNIKMDL